jgi:transcriptional regulator with XRE-family HTH domain
MELARRAGVSPSYVSLIEHGEKIPSEEVAVRIARALDEREDLYRVWAVTARMDEKTREAVLRLRHIEPDLHPLTRPSAEEESALAEIPEQGSGGLSTLPPGRRRDSAMPGGSVLGLLGEEALGHALSIPMLVPGAVPRDDPPGPEDVETLLTLDARMLRRTSADGLVLLRLDEANSLDVATWLKPHDLVVVDRHPAHFDPSLIHAFSLPDEGLRLARASVAGDVLLLLADPGSSHPPRAVPLPEPGHLGDVMFGTVVWCGRAWQPRGD